MRFNKEDIQTALALSISLEQNQLTEQYDDLLTSASDVSYVVMLEEQSWKMVRSFAKPSRVGNNKPDIKKSNYWLHSSLIYYCAIYI